jgi:hypothetical protein
MKRFSIHHLVLILMLGSSACVSSNQEPTANPPTATGETEQEMTPSVTAVPKDTETPTSSPTITLTPTETTTPTPVPTPIGGGNGYLLMMVDESIIRISLEDRNQVETIVSSSDLTTTLNVGEISNLRTGSISPDGSVSAFWNCATHLCDTRRGTFYLFTSDLQKKISFEAAGYPSFLGWSANHDRLLYYLWSTMADDYYMVKTKAPGFGEVIHLGRVTDVTWSGDKQTLFSQRGNVVSQLDKDGKELKRYTCNFNYNCINDPSPDGKRFAGLPSLFYGGDPYVTFSNQDFTEKKTVKIPIMKIIPLIVDWLPDNQRVVIYSLSFKQWNYSYIRFDTLGVMDADSGNLRVANWEIPESVAWFVPCGLSPDGNYVVFTGAGGRSKEQGRLMLNERYLFMFPVSSDQPALERVTNFDKAWESCPTWME